jgi:hypothetical protein
MLSAVVTLQPLSLRPYPQILLEPEIRCSVKAHHAKLSVIRLSVVRLNVITLSVVVTLQSLSLRPYPEILLKPEFAVL